MIILPFYAGYLEYPKWEVPWTKAKHEPLISLEEHEKIKEILGMKNKPRRSDTNELFPLAGMIACSNCKKILTRAVQKNRYGKKYPMYVCKNRKCSKKDNIQSHLVHDEISRILEHAQIKEEHLIAIKEMIQEHLKESTKKIEQEKAQLKRDIQNKEKELQKLIDSITNVATSGSPQEVIDRLNQKFSQVSKDKSALEELLAKMNEGRDCIEPQIYQALEWLGRLDRVWQIGSTDDRSKLIKNIFEPGFVYIKKTGVLNYRFVPLFKYILDFAAGKNTDGAW